MREWPADQVERRPLIDLLPRAGNPRLHPDWQIAQIARSIEEWGWTIPILVDEHGEVIAGHGRIMAALKLDIAEVPVMIARNWTEAQKRAYVIADNQLALNSSWDFAMLSSEIAELTSVADISLLGFSDAELRRIGRDANPDLFDKPRMAEDVPTVAKPGDIWCLGNHRILCGDASDAASWSRLCGGRLIDLVVTSPPYNQGIEKFKPSGKEKETPGFVKRMASTYFDSMEESEYRDWQISTFTMIAEFIAPTGALFYNHKIRYRDKRIMHPMEWITKFPFRIRQEIIWDRSASMTLNARMFIPADERIYWLTKSDDFYFSNETAHKAFTSVWKVAPVNDVKVSAAFATEIPRRAIAACSPEAALVADPFSGSGTTLIAAEQLGRSCVAMEIDPRYVDVSIDRWQTFTGQQAVLERAP